MKKIREKTARRLMALLAAVCMVGTMPGTAVISHAEEKAEESSEINYADTEGQGENQEDPGVKKQTEDGEQGAEKTGKDTENTEGGENQEKPEDSDDTEESEDREETGDTEQPKETGEFGDQDDTGESGAGETDDPEEEDSEKEETPEETPDGEKNAEDEETDTGEVPDGEEIIGEEETVDEAEAEEAEEAGIMLLSAQEDSGVLQDTNTYTDENGVIYHYYGYEDGTAEIYELESYEGIIGRYKPINIPSQVGDYTVTRLTFTFSSTSSLIPSVTIPETITYMEGSLFKFMTILELHYNAEAAETGAAGESSGVFFRGDIREFHLGENVRSIPDYCFDSADMTIDELTLHVESIGKKAFFNDKQITTLTFGENVEYIGFEAFGDNEIENINYNAINAQSAPYGKLAMGTFTNVSVSNIIIGSQVTVIPEHLFSNIDYTADTLIFPDCLTTVGAMAFYGNGISIGELTIGENVTSIGEEAFARGQIGVLHYNAVDAKVALTEEVNEQHRSSFDQSAIGELRIGNRVKSLPDTLFYAIGLTQDTLVLPDSITYIGAYVLSHSGDVTSGKTVQIGTLEIGENVAHIGRAAFGRNTYDRVVVRTVEADVPPSSDLQIELPICREIEIHGKSPYYHFFSRNTDEDHITLLCEDFEVIRGEEYYDAGKKSFVTPITDACTVCGYGTAREEYSEACTVIFTDYDGTELSRQYLHKGDNATAPEEPERTGYEFTGWNQTFTGVTSDLTVRAEYEIKKFSVVFKDGSRTISEQEIAYKKDAKAPENPTRPEEEWGTWKFTGWDGSYTNVTKDEVVTAQFEKVLNQYEVLFYDAEGNVISRQTVAHGEAAEEPEAPEKEPTVQYTYIFTGWSADTENVTGDTEFRPVYDSETRSYTVKFMDGGTLLDTQTVAYGDDATAPAEPTRPEEEWGKWRFAGWNGNYTNIAKDEIIRAAFEKILNEYEVIFYDAEDNILSRQAVKHGMRAEAPKVPDIEPTERECYVFTGWDGDISNITGESHFHPVYETKARMYTVTFMNGDVTHDVQEVAYGSAASTPSNPSRKEDKVYTYRFICWDKDYSYIKGDMTIRAVFEQVVKPKDGDTDEEKPKENEKDKPEGKDRDGEKPGDGEPIAEAVKKILISVPDTVSGNDTEKKLSFQLALPQMEEKQEPAFPIPEIPDESLQPAGTKAQADTPADEKAEDEGVEKAEPAEPKEPENTGRHIPGWLWLLLLAGAGTGVWGIWLWLAGAGERTICGTVVDEDGTAVSGVNVTLTGEAGEPVETQTDEDGQYLFEDLKKDNYRLCFHYINATGLLLLDVHMERRGRKKVFSVLKSTVNAVETKRSGGTYQIDVTV